MSLSIIVLALYIFLQSSAGLGWFAVDPKLIGAVGIFFVIVVILEALFVVYRGRPFLPVRAFSRSGE